MESPTKNLSVPLPHEVVAWIEEEAKRQMRSVRAQAAIILQEHVKKVEQEEAQ